MVNTVAALCLALSLFQVAGAGQISPVQKVVQMIDEMAVKVQAALAETEKNFEEFAKYCDDESYAKDYAIKDSSEKMEQLHAVIDDSNAKISAGESNIQDISEKISEQESEVQKSDQLRKKQNEQFLATEKNFLGIIESLDGAKKVFETATGASLLQMAPEQKAQFDNVIASVRAAVESVYVTHEDRAQVQAFLQAREDAQYSLTLKGGNDATLQVLEQLEEFSDRTLSKARKKEGESAHSHAMLKQGLESDIKSLNEEMKEATGNKLFASESLAEAQKSLAREQKGSDEDTASLAELKTECQKKATEFEAESRDNNAELGALAKAKEILTNKFASFVQTRASRTMVQTRGGDDTRARALRQIQQLGKKFHSTSLITLAYRASSSPFGKVSAMIEDMIAKLQQEAAEEATQKAFCDTEIGASTKSKAKKEASLDKTNARIAKANSGIAKLAEAGQVLAQELTDIDAGMKEATTIRSEEKAVFTKVEKDYAESEEACAAAIQALREYYEGASLLQLAARTGVKTTKGEGIIGLLEVAESDFAKLLAEVRTVEETAVADYNQMGEDQKMAKATKEVEAKSKRSELKSLRTALANYNGDKDGVSSELDAVVAYLDKLQPQCETKVETYAERKAAREAEIAGLKDALNILEAPALLQTSRHLRSSVRMH